MWAAKFLFALVVLGVIAVIFKLGLTLLVGILAFFGPLLMFLVWVGFALAGGYLVVKIVRFVIKGDFGGAFLGSIFLFVLGGVAYRMWIGPP
jgi:hypothetical protein